MKILIRYTHRAVLAFTFLALVVLAIAVSVLRFWLLPGIDAFRESLEGRIGAQLGESVRIEKLSARLHGIHPEVQLKGLNILDRQGRSAIRFDTVRLNLDTVRTLATREPRFDRVEIVGPKLIVRRSADGRIAVEGLTAGGTPPAWLLADGRIDLRSAELVWQDHRLPPLALGRVNLRLRNEGGHHRLSAAFALPKGLGKTLRLAAEGEGDPLAAGAFRGRAYLEGQGLDLARWSAGFRPGRFGVGGGRADFRLWLDWPGQPGAMLGDLNLKSPVLVHRPDAATEHRFALKSLSTRLRFVPDSGGWRLDLPAFRPALPELWPDTRVAVAVRKSAEGGIESIAAIASRLDLADLAAATHGLGLAGDRAGEALRALSPRGTLEDVRLFVAPEAPTGQRLGLCAGFRSLTVNAWKMAPGLADFGGRACGTDAAGRASLVVRGGRLDLTGIGVRPVVPLDRLEATLGWRQTEGAYVIDVPELNAANPELSARYRFRIALPKAPGLTPYLDLTARLTDVNIATLHHYAPRAFMPETSAWIERSLLAGNIPRWDILFRGDTGAYPFYQHQGVFQSVIDMENVTFRYSRDWPLVTQAKVRFEFDGPTATVDADAGLVGTGRILSTHALVEDTFLGTWVRLNGEVEAGVAESMDFLAQSPLRRIPEQLRKIMEVSGDSRIAMRFDIPLDDRLGKLQLQGTAQLEQAAVRLKDLDLALENIDGPLRFDPEGIRAEGVAARFLGRPATVGVAPEKDFIRLDLRGRAATDDLGKAFPAGFWRFLRGEGDYRLRVAIPESLDARSSPLGLALASDLRGLSLDLPAPLGKPAEVAWPLAVEADFQAGEPIPLRLSLGSNLKARLRFAATDGELRAEAGDLALGLPLHPDDGRRGFTFAAHLDGLDAGVWYDWWKGLGDGAASGAALREFRLDTGKLAWHGRDFGAVDLGFAGRGARWEGRIDGDRARGEVFFAPEGIHLNLDRITLPDFAGLKGGEPAAPAVKADAEADPDPAAIPPIRVQARHVIWNGGDLGPLELETERRAHGMILRELRLKGRGHELAVHGDWTRTPNRAPSTRVEGKLHIDALGNLLTLAGKSGQVRDTPTDIDFALNWPGAPQRVSAQTLAGEVRLKLGKGSLPGIEPGLGRIIGVLNFNALWRRLSLDFSDLFGKGLVYDGIAGTFRIGQGQAVTEAFLIDAVSAQILMTGRIGLAARDIDQFVTVIPHMSAALPLAGTLAGGPAVGAAMLVAEQLLGEQMDKITASQYAVRGGWDAPVTTRIYRKLPLDVLEQAWSGVKKLSGFSGKKEEKKP